MVGLEDTSFAILLFSHSAIPMSFPLFLLPILAGLAAQALKPLFSRRWREDQARRLDPRPRYGGMPSAHAAFASSLLAVAYVAEGWNSAAFAIAVAIFILVLDDALRLRIFLGRYGAALQRLVGKLPKADQKTLPPIEHRMGHNVPEVVGGVLVGLLVTLVVFWVDGTP